ncbi:MAG: rRNA maturation RNase YbeY [Deltaproteobacteria bacterium]|jgi:probable rRNA maturation factor|nr:rRNA maturation RNase YbeY [Deltaproteobacteria bacterium]
MVILVLRTPAELPISELKIKRRIGKILKALKKADSSLTILVTDDQEIRELNHNFRGVDRSTNVLAFPWEDEPTLEPEVPPPYPNYLGDISISFEYIQRESHENALDVGYLLFFYIIHGLLHLLGYDHEKGPAEELAQDEETERLLKLIPHSL